MWISPCMAILSLMPQIFCLLSENQDRNASNFLFEVVPSPVVTLTGDDAVFHCVSRCDGIIWLINDTIAGAVMNVATRTETTSRRDGEPGRESMLWITATVFANNSVIKCAVEDWNNNLNRYTSPGVLLKIQGLLQAPANVELKIQWNNDLLQVIFSWEQPFTLNITDQENEINLMYIVFVSSYGNSTYEVYNTSATQFIYNLNISAIIDHEALSKNNICNDIILPAFQVSAINGIGIGERNEMVYLHDALCSPGPSVSTASTAIPNSTTTTSTVTDIVPKPTNVHNNLSSIMSKPWITVIAVTGALLLVIIAMGAVMLVLYSITVKRKLLKTTREQVSSFNLNTNDAYVVPAAIQQTPSGERRCSIANSTITKETDEEYQQCNPPEDLYAEITCNPPKEL